MDAVLARFDDPRVQEEGEGAVEATVVHGACCSASLALLGAIEGQITTLWQPERSENREIDGVE